MLTIRIRCRISLVKLLLLGFQCVKLVLPALIIELRLGFLHCFSQASHVFNQAHILLHDVQVVFSVECSHLLVLVVQFLIRIGQELSLSLEFFLDVLVDVFLLLLRV